MTTTEKTNHDQVRRESVARKRGVYRVALILAAAVLVLVAVPYFALRLRTLPLGSWATTMDHHAQVGDAMTPVGILVSALAFLALALQIFLQREDLRLQREDLELYKTELRKQNETLSETAKVQQEQQRALVASALATEAQVALMRRAPVERFLSQASAAFANLEGVQASLVVMQLKKLTFKGSQVAAVLDMGLRRISSLDCPQSLPVELREKAMDLTRRLNSVVQEYQVLYGTVQEGTWGTTGIEELNRSASKSLEAIRPLLGVVTDELRVWCDSSE